jgi:hypothetical protein
LRLKEEKGKGNRSDKAKYVTWGFAQQGPKRSKGGRRYIPIPFLKNLRAIESLEEEI